MANPSRDIDRVELVACDPTWPGEFARIERELRAALGKSVRRLEHVDEAQKETTPDEQALDVVLVAVHDKECPVRTTRRLVRQI